MFVCVLIWCCFVYCEEMLKAWYTNSIMVYVVKTRMVICTAQGNILILNSFFPVFRVSLASIFFYFRHMCIVSKLMALQISQDLILFSLCIVIRPNSIHQSPS
jgi:hypothetical protein